MWRRQRVPLRYAALNWCSPSVSPSIFDAVLILRIRGFAVRHGVIVSPDGSIWNAFQLAVDQSQMTRSTIDRARVAGLLSALTALASAGRRAPPSLSLRIFVVAVRCLSGIVHLIAEVVAEARAMQVSTIVQSEATS